MLGNSIMSDMPNGSVGTRLSRFVRKTVPTGAATSSQIVRSSENSRFDVPTIDTRVRYGNMFKRHPEDKNYIKPFDELDSKPYKPKIPQLISRDPSYTHFKVPFQMACKERYNNSIKKYEGQFGHEIRSLIDNQPTAREATYLCCVLYHFMAAISQ
ncbi:uncharacterized protein Dvir_GJ26853, isoform A [Drosophila virilis]|uniref:Uncharacterized protein, isoform A n=1 Tax=Drosophila virilis TaxID=7244 RepID=A0A0Q9W9M9_DROVI|nr:uncharacterized protein LOC26531623 isoform X2 [Drosophila virilis]KRF78919.1 uncharacterized protein Dvir_GJ26853, isoform A [Drosophila virilis]